MSYSENKNRHTVMVLNLM